MSKRRQKVLVTGGPTRAYLDDVRFLTNYSTGNLARELCATLSAKGFEVSAVFGPTAFGLNEVRASRKQSIETHNEMRQAVLRECRAFEPDYVIFAAAVLDFAPKAKKPGKVSSKGTWKIELVPTSKILEEVKNKFPKIKRVGFKLETKKLTGRALQKFAENKIAEQGLHALVFNFFSDVVAKDHRARVFTANGESKTAIGKKKIASLIVDTCLI